MTHPATPTEIPAMSPLLLEAARVRAGRDPALWPLTDNPSEAVEQALNRAMTAENPPFRQQWLRSDAGLTHGIHLPVPPIYAGRFGAPGLIMDDSTLSPDASADAAAQLLVAAEEDLRGHGARILLAASAPGGAFEAAFQAAGYAPLTLYYARSGLTPSASSRTSVPPNDTPEAASEAATVPPGTAAPFSAAHPFSTPAPSPDAPTPPDTSTLSGSAAPPSATPTPGAPTAPSDTHSATEADLPGIALRSAESRATLQAIDPFWEPHPEAAERFSAWMARSLTLPDRDMIVSRAEGAGYVIAQPATPLHVPPAHATAHLGIIDDWHHAEMADPAHLAAEGTGARALLQAAESALAARGRSSALVVCPAGWLSKRAVLEAAGYRVALTWYRKA